MTIQTVDDLYDDATRLNQSVVDAMREWAGNHPDTPWHVEYEIPAETNGWVYYGDGGAAATVAYWGDTFPEPNKGVVARIQPTHPQSETCDVALAEIVPDIDHKTEKREIARFDGEPYRTPLYVRRRLFWQAVEAAIGWMGENPPDSV